MTVGIGFSSAPARALSAEDAEPAKDFLFGDLDAVWLEEVFAGATACGVGVGFLLFFFAGPSVPSVVKAFRFLSARAIASASHAAFTFPRDAGRLLVHSADPSSPPICAIVRPVRMEVSYASSLISNPATT